MRTFCVARAVISMFFPKETTHFQSFGNAWILCFGNSSFSYYPKSIIKFAVRHSSNIYLSAIIRAFFKKCDYVEQEDDG